MSASTSTPFTFYVDQAKRLVSFTPRGTWKAADAHAMLSSFEQAAKALGPGDWFLLIDARSWAPQPQEVQGLIVTCMRLNKRNGLKRAARVVDVAIIKMQLDRLANQSEHDRRDFTDLPSAMKWLTTGQA